ncbi:hypothetical protein C8R46DRAFT_1199192 [Mycena filopes]|nr:hypothetical protein C8R46DRAFT_1199192 [Mycena filopes]
MARLFAEHTPALQSVFIHFLTVNSATIEVENPPLPRVRLKTLSWGKSYLYMEPTWLLEPSSPLDPSALTRLEFRNSGGLSPTMYRVINRARHSLRHLTIDAQLVMSDASPRAALLADLRALTTLTLVTTAHEPADVISLLAALPHSSALRALTLQVRKIQPLRVELMRTLGVACAESLPRACVVTVHLLPFGIAAALDSAQEERLMREAFAALEVDGRLRVVL